MEDERDDDLRPLTPQELLFCEAYASPESETYSCGTKSAERAGYGQPHNAQWRLRQRPAVQKRIAEFHEIAAAGLGKVMADLEATRLLALAKKDYATATRCSELQAKRLGAFVDRVELNLPTTKALSVTERQEARKIAEVMLREGHHLSPPRVVDVESPPGALPTTSIGRPDGQKDEE